MADHEQPPAAGPNAEGEAPNDNALLLPGNLEPNDRRLVIFPERARWVRRFINWLNNLINEPSSAVGEWVGLLFGILVAAAAYIHLELQLSFVSVVLMASLVALLSAIGLLSARFILWVGQALLESLIPAWRERALVARRKEEIDRQLALAKELYDSQMASLRALNRPSDDEWLKQQILELTDVYRATLDSLYKRAFRNTVVSLDALRPEFEPLLMQLRLERLPPEEIPLEQLPLPPQTPLNPAPDQPPPETPSPEQPPPESPPQPPPQQPPSERPPSQPSPEDSQLELPLDPTPSNDTPHDEGP